MNVSELGRRLRVNPKEMQQVLPEFGFDIGAKAVKVDDRVAEQIMREWPRIKRELDRRATLDREAKKVEERAARQDAGATVALPPVLSVKDFADRLHLPITRVIMELMKNGILVAQNERIDRDTATIIAGELGFKVEAEQEKEEAAAEESLSQLAKIFEEEEGVHLAPRSPVVVVMGHVDHGKTKLLDTIRKTNVIAGESGGITQHIGAYQVDWRAKDGTTRAITFIDTPGHEAFTVMRSRGAKVADIAILVVAADDGVQPQTVEAINIIKAAKLPFVVAINKIDKEDANPDKVKTELSQRGVQPEEWGGDVPMVPISARENLHIDKLLDVLLLVADMHGDSIRANPARAAAGTIIDSRVDKGEGPVATVLVQAGTLKIGDPLVVGEELYGKVRAMKNYRGEEVKEAPPSMPVKILGFKLAPDVGDIIDVSRAAGATKVDTKQKRSVQTGAVVMSIAESEHADEEEGGKKYFNMLVKADTLGSLEAILGELDKLQYTEVGVKVISKGLGNITDNDVRQAEAASAAILGFHVWTTPIAEQLIREGTVVFQRFEIIYDLLNFVHKEVEKLLQVEVVITEVARGIVLKVFRTEKKTQTLGIRVEDGTIVLGLRARAVRKDEALGEVKLVSLQVGHGNAKSVPSGSECGIGIEGRVALQEHDRLEFYTTAEKKRTLA